MEKLKPYIPLIIAIVVLVIVYKVASFFEKSPDEKEAEQKTKDNIGSLPVSKAKLSYPANKYPIIADNIYNSGNSYWFSDGSLLKSQIELIKTEDDFNQLMKAFGVKGGEDMITFVQKRFPRWSINPLEYTLGKANDYLKSRKISYQF